MNADQATLLINSTFSLIELIIKLRQENPSMFVNQEEKIKILQLKLKSLEEKPKDYLQQWED
jgi:hypothetical protein